jgi:outer membrane protein assembly factor BamB
VGWGQVYGISDTATVVAHDARTGAVAWTRDLEVAPGNQVDMAPSLMGGCVLVSTQGLVAGSRGTLYALDHTDGSIVWQFETVPDDFWGNKKENNGGGAWYPPAVDPETGRSYWGTSNPWPAPGAPGFPAGASRPGDNLYTNSALAIDADGSLAWYHQVFKHDIWDRDMVLTQIVDLPGGERVIVHTGKGGRVLGYDPDTGAVRWDVSVGLHQNDDLTTFDEPTTVMPGVLGGVETPPAAADGKVYVAVVNAATTHDSPEERFSLSPQLGTHPSHLVAIDAATGHIDWTTEVPGDDLGGVTIVNDLLLTSTFGGTLLAYDRATGAEVWRRAAGGTVNGSPAVVGDTIVWPVSGTSPSRLVALRLDAVPQPTTTTTTIPGTTPTTTRPGTRPGATPAQPRPGRPTFTG